MIELGSTVPRARPIVIRSTARQIWAATFLLLAVAVGAAYSEAPRGSKGDPWTAALLGLGLTALAIRVGTVRVCAGEEGLLVRNLWRTRRIRWMDVAEIQVVELTRPWRRPVFIRRGDLGITVHLHDGGEVLLDASVRARLRGTGSDTYGPPFDRWVAALEGFRAPYRVSWN